MKLKSLLLVFTLAALGFAACGIEDKDLGAPAATLSTQTVSIAQEGGSATVDVSATRDWTVSTDADWIGYNPTSGKASDETSAITITVAANTEYERSGEVIFEVGDGLITKVITVTQPGLKVKEVHYGTVESPYSVEEALALIMSGTYPDSKVYVKGIISSIDTEKDYPGNNFGNATYWISDDGTEAEQLEVYRGFGLGGARMTKDYIKIGDEVVVFGQLVMFGSTPEITQGSQLYSLNGITAGGGEAEDITVSDFIANADRSTAYRLTGTVSGFNAQYCSFDLTDATGTIYVYSVSNKDEWKDKISNGGTVVLIGYYEYYAAKEQHEVVNATIKSFTAGSPDDPGTPSGEGTLESPFNVAAVIAFTKALGADVLSENQVYAKGRISKITYPYDVEHGTATYKISDDESAGNEFTVYGSYYLENKPWLNGNMQIKVDDEVIVCGNVIYYKGETPEFASQKNYLVSLNGITTDEGGDPGDEPGGETENGAHYLLNATAQTWSEESDATYGLGFSATTYGIKTGYYKHTSSSDAVAPKDNHIRIYKNSAFVVTAPEGKSIASIVISVTAADYCTNMPELGDSATATADTEALTVSWAGTAKNQVVLHATASQIRAKAIEITYSE